MNIFLYAVFAVLGVIIGSFLNVVILRYNTGKGLGGRSMCFSCRTTLRGIDLVPVLSFLFFRGRCRTCKSKISKQYISIELLTAFLFVLALHHNLHLFGLTNLSFDVFFNQGLRTFANTNIFSQGLIHNFYVGQTLTDPLSLYNLSVLIFGLKLAIDLVIMSVLVFMTGYDMRHKIIPDPSVFLFGLLALLGQLVIGALSWNIFWAGIILAAPFYFIWLLSGGRLMGLGDAKLALGMGWMLGLALGATAVFFGFWLGAIISVGLLIIQKIMGIDKIRYFLRALHVPRLTIKSEVPFAPFLIAGLLIVYVLGYNLFAFSL